MERAFFQSSPSVFFPLSIISSGVPRTFAETRKVDLSDKYASLTKYEIVEQGTMVAILALGNFFKLRVDVLEKIKQGMEYRQHLSILVLLSI